jgi:5-methyltetrahydropteroyltriglutamate--homocysteine methyltransferase
VNSSTADTKPFFRADHVGSLLRPQNLLDAREKSAAGDLSADALAEIEDAAIRDAVKLQEEVGLHAITDGEFRRENYWLDFLTRMPGVDTSGKSFRKFEGSSYQPRRPEVRGKIEHHECLMARDYSFLASRTGETVKITIPTPSRVHSHGGRAAIDETVYPDMEEFWDDLAAFYRAEIAALEQLGCRFIQIDDPVFSYFIGEEVRETLRVIDEDPDELIHTYVRLLDACTRDRRPGTDLGLHICRGNAQSAWITAGGYDRIAEAVFASDFDSFFLEYDDERSGGFEPLRHMPKGRKVVLGLVTSKRGDMESADELKRRIDEASKYVPLDDLALSPQCGFASVDKGNKISSDDQRRKLELVVGTAREVWGDA